MKSLAAVGMCMISFGVFGCAAESGANEAASSESNLSSQLGTNQAIRCEAGPMKVALVGDTDGKATLITLTPAASLYTLLGRPGTLTASTEKWSWKSASASLELDSNLKGTLSLGAEPVAVTCASTAPNEAASWATAKALTSYQNDVDSLASTVIEEMSSFQQNNQNANDANHEPKPYPIFAVETSRRGELDLGTRVANTAGALPGEDGESFLDENDWSYGGLSAAYNLGGGDDWGEWFQAASDGVSLAGSVTPALGSARAGFIVHQNVGAISTLVDSAQPYAIELTVGGLTFFMPDAFSK